MNTGAAALPPEEDLQEVFIHDQDDEKEEPVSILSITPQWRCFKPSSFVSPLTPTPEPLITPSGLRFVADLPLRKNELGYEYVHLFLEEQDEPASLDVLLSEIDYSHLIWEIRRGNVLLLEALTEDSVITEILTQVLNEGRDYPPTSAPLMGQLCLKHTASCIDLLTWEAKNAMLYVPDEDKIEKVVGFLISQFLEQSKTTAYKAPPKQISIILDVFSYNPRSRDKVLSYLIKTDSEAFIRSLLRHLDVSAVYNFVLTLTALLSPYPPLAAQPTNQLKFNTRRHSTAFGTDASLAIKFNQWLSKGNFIPLLLAAFLQQGDKHEHATEVTEHAAAVLVEILVVAERLLSKGLEAPLILTDLMEDSTLTNFIVSVLAHKEARVLSEGVGIFEEMLKYDHTRRMLEKQFAQASPTESAKKIIDPAQALLQIIQVNVNLLFDRMALKQALYGDEEGKDDKDEKSYQAGRKSFGGTRIRLLEFLERLLAHFLSEHVASEPSAQFLEALRAHSFWPLLLDALTTFPLNNLLHITIMHIIEVVLDSSEQKVRIELLTEDKLLDKIVAANERNKESERKGLGFRESYMGAIIEISEALLQAGAKDSVIANILESHEGWRVYLAETLRPVLAIRNRERDPVEDVLPLEAHFGGGIPLALVARLLASQPGVSHDASNNNLIEVLIQGEDVEEDDGEGVQEAKENVDNVKGGSDDVGGKSGVDGDDDDHMMVDGEMGEHMVTVVTGEYDEVIIHMTETELAEMRKEENV